MKRNAERYIYVVLSLLLLVCATGCRSHKNKKIQKDEDFIVETLRVKPKGMDKLRKRIVAEALSWKGTPYRYAGSEKGIGTDCSGMVLRVYEDAASCKLPRNSKKQAEFCKEIGKGEVKPGDLAFFATGSDKRAVSHVGIMIDKERFIHASGSKGVIVSELSTPYYKRTFLKFGRFPTLK